MPDIKPADYCFSTIQVSSASERIQGLHELQHKCQDEFVKREVWWQGYAGVADYSDAPLKVRHNAEAWGFNTCNPLLTTQWTHFDLKLKVSENLEILILKWTICIAYWDRWHLVSKVKQLIDGTTSKLDINLEGLVVLDGQMVYTCMLFIGRQHTQHINVC